MRRRATMRRRLAQALLVAALAIVPGAAFAGGTERLVVIKADGLPYDLVEQVVRTRNPRTGRSALPWITHVFFERGTRLSNFYIRGLSLSASSWSTIDTGQHLQIRGNIEYDRYTKRPYDYLNFFPFWIDSARQRVTDMWGPTVLDGLGVPLLFDAYRYGERHQSFQLYQRGTRFMTLAEALRNRVTSRTPRQLIGESYALGLETRNILIHQMERELIAKLDDPQVRYLDYYYTEFDHASHHNRDRATHLVALRDLDETIGRIWTAIQRTPEADRTTLVLVSDHGVNSDERVYSQGYNLVDLLRSAAGGGHHTVTKRRVLNNYTIKGIYPLIPLITTVSQASTYLQGRQDYTTALVDLDGNERASLHLRHSALNVLQVLAAELRRPDLPAPVRRAAVDTLLATVSAQREDWQRAAAGLRGELDAVERMLDERRRALPPPPPARDRRRAAEHPPEDDETREARIRDTARVEAWTTEVAGYRAYLATLDRLLGMTAEAWQARDLRIEDVIPPGTMGERNTLFDLQHYVVGPAPGGLVLASDGTLDVERSFERINYFELFDSRRVRNSVQAGVGNKPVDFVAVRLPCEALQTADEEVRRAPTCVWLYGGREAQALVVSGTDEAGALRLRYVPVARLTQDRVGAIRFTPIDWQEGLPLRLVEDEALDVPGAARLDWLNGWHTDTEWLQATHRTRYSNAVVGLHEHFARHTAPSLDPDEPGLQEDERLVRRFRVRQRALVEPDLLIHASFHWNFNVSELNPGGNHGSFFRVSTHATLMFAGGDATGIPQGLAVEDPYDSLSVMPTLLALTGRLQADGTPDPDLQERGFRAMPGRVIRQVLGGRYRLTTDTLPLKDVSDRIAPSSP